MELVNALGADGVHLGKNDMPVAEARKILGPSRTIGATANTFADIEKAVAAGADYIGLGPFRFTVTKRNLSPVLGLEGYSSIMKKCAEAGISVPVVAIGGITAEDIDGIMETGVAGIAVSGASSLKGLDGNFLETDVADIDISGASSARFVCNDTLSGAVSGASSAICGGDSDWSVSTSGASSIKRK